MGLVTEGFGLRGKSFRFDVIDKLLSHICVIAIKMLATRRETLCLITKELGSRGKNIVRNRMDYRKVIIEHLNKNGFRCVNPNLNVMLYGIYKLQNTRVDNDVKKFIKSLSNQQKKRKLKRFAKYIEMKLV